LEEPFRISPSTIAAIPERPAEPIEATAPRPYDPPAEATPLRAASAVAHSLRGITIDGDLRDWPPAIPRYPVRKLLVSGDLGYGGLDGADLSTSPDLSIAFSAGYSLEEQVIYLAVIVRDDTLIVGNTSHLDTDAVEIYVDGLHGDRRIPIPGVPWWEHVSLSDLPALQYIGIPGPGRVYGTKYDTNPILLGGDLKKTKTRMAFRRAGSVTTYEWAVQPFDRYPDRPTRLEPGKRIGFDLAVADKDVPAVSPGGMNEPEEDRVAWAYWGPQWTGMKMLDAGNLGELVLAGPP
jgi:hypothetical protein